MCRSDADSVSRTMRILRNWSRDVCKHNVCNLLGRCVHNESATSGKERIKGKSMKRSSRPLHELTMELRIYDVSAKSSSFVLR